jgi:hypothetical protein
MLPLVLAMTLRLTDFFNRYTAAPHQIAAINQLQEDLPPHLLDRSASWFEIWKAGGRVEWLPTPYFHQLDLPNGYRKCFTAAAAMVAADQARVLNPHDYDKVRAKYGDTTEIYAHIRAFKDYGLTAEFLDNATPDTLQAEIDAGRPVAVGWLHHGDLSKGERPRGYGHWSVIVGYTDQFFVAHDPMGTPDFIHGGHKDQSAAKYVLYPKRHWLKRWEVEGPGTGWAIRVTGGWSDSLKDDDKRYIE